jgi:hypothetical protein
MAGSGEFVPDNHGAMFEFCGVSTRSLDSNLKFLKGFCPLHACRDKPLDGVRAIRYISHRSRSSFDR